MGEGSGGGGFGKGREPGMVQRGGQAAGPAAKPPTRAKPVCFDAVETACGRWGEGFGFWERAAEGEGLGRGGSRGWCKKGGAQGAGRRPGGRWWRKALPCMGKRISKTPKRPRSDVP